MLDVIKICGYWNDDKTEFTDYLVKQTHDFDENEDDDNIFYYGLEEDFIKSNLNNENTGLEFTITSYSI